MSNDYLAPVAARLTVNGALNLRASLTDPHDRFPDLLNGGRRLSTGLGKWTWLAMLGIENHLLALKLVERKVLPWNGQQPWQMHEALVLTPLGREVAQYLIDHWDSLTFRDTRAEKDARDRRLLDRFTQSAPGR